MLKTNSGYNKFELTGVNTQQAYSGNGANRPTSFHRTLLVLIKLRVKKMPASKCLNFMFSSVNN